MMDQKCLSEQSCQNQEIDIKKQYALSENCFPLLDNQCYKSFPQLDLEGVQYYTEWISGFKKTDSRI